MYPPEMRRREHVGHEARTLTQLEVAKQLSGLPGSLTLSPIKTHKYFGAEARTTFFERSKWLNRQLAITNKRKHQKTSTLLFDNMDRAAAAEDFAFAPSRPKTAPEMSTRGSMTLSICGDGDGDDDDDPAFDLLCSPLPSRLPGDSRAQDTIVGAFPSTPSSARSSISASGSARTPLSLPSLRASMSASCAGRTFSAEEEEIRWFEGIRVPRTDRSDLSSVDDSLNISADLALHDAANDLAVPTSPRTRYLAACSRHGINPRPSLIVRKLLTKELNLKHQGDVSAALLKNIMHRHDDVYAAVCCRHRHCHLCCNVLRNGR